jgi:hypothetical protein
MRWAECLSTMTADSVTDDPHEMFNNAQIYTEYRETKKVHVNAYKNAERWFATSVDLE